MPGSQPLAYRAAEGQAGLEPTFGCCCWRPGATWQRTSASPGREGHPGGWKRGPSLGVPSAGRGNATDVGWGLGASLWVCHRVALLGRSWLPGLAWGQNRAWGVATWVPKRERYRAPPGKLAVSSCQQGRVCTSSCTHALLLLRAR